MTNKHDYQDDTPLEKLLEQLPTYYVSDQELVDYATGQLNAKRQLIVRAYLERNPEEKAQVMQWREAYRRETHVEAPPQIATWFAQLVQAVGVRGAEDNDDSLSFYASQLDAQVTLYPLPTGEDAWMIEGFVTLEKIPSADRAVTLTTPSGDTTVSHSDEGGFFTFENLTSGTYQLDIAFDSGNIAVRDIVIPDE